MESSSSSLSLTLLSLSSLSSSSSSDNSLAFVAETMTVAVGNHGFHGGGVSRRGFMSSSEDRSRRHTMRRDDRQRRGRGVRGGIMDVGAREMEALHQPPHRAATPRPSAKQMGRDPDTDPKMLYPGGYFDRQSAVGVRCDTMIFANLCRASPWCGGGNLCPTLFRNYLRTGASTWRGLNTSAQRTARP